MYKYALKISITFTVLAMLYCQKSTAQFSEKYQERAKEIIAKMTLDEKVSQLHGTSDKENYRIVLGIPGLGIPDLPLTNGPAGMGPAGKGHSGKATALPAPISLAATWDTGMAKINGEIAGGEAAGYGNVLLESPDVNIARTPHNGRTFEGYGEDPFLSGEIAVANIQGIQSKGVMANVKHYAANSQETNRFHIDEIIDERVLHEIYLPAFEAAVKRGHVASVMAAYNKVNGHYCTENDILLNQILKKDWNFQGFVTSDFGATHSTVPCARYGLDLELPGGKYFGEELKKSVLDKTVPESLLDEKLLRRFSTMMAFGVWDKQPQHKPIPAENAALAMKLGAEGIVLLKNDKNILPFHKEHIRSIALIGPYSGNASTGGGGSSHVSPFLTVKPTDGIRAIVGAESQIYQYDGKVLDSAIALAKSCDKVILMLGDNQTEGRDHPITLKGNQDSLAAAILAANPNAVIVLKTGGPVLMPWINHCHALLEAWYPGEEDGAAIANVLFGLINPSGRLPITFPANDSDGPIQSPEQYPGVDSVARYSEGVFVGYRWYDEKKVAPLFPFGYGLSYTQFAFKDLKVNKTGLNEMDVTFKVSNTGHVAGAEVAQVYVSIPSSKDIPEPPHQLKGFVKVELAPGESKELKIHLNKRAFSYWNTKKHNWAIMAGNYTISVGSSSRALLLSRREEIK